MATASPLARVKQNFGDKKSLVARIQELSSQGGLWIDRYGADGSLAHVSNAKLLRLFDTLTEAGKRFSSRDALVDALVKAEGRGSDADYKKHFADWSVPRLMDALAAAEKRAKNA